MYPRKVVPISLTLLHLKITKGAIRLEGTIGIFRCYCMKQNMIKKHARWFWGVVLAANLTGASFITAQVLTDVDTSPMTNSCLLSIRNACEEKSAPAADNTPINSGILDISFNPQYFVTNAPILTPAMGCISSNRIAVYTGLYYAYSIQPQDDKLMILKDDGSVLTNLSSLFPSDGRVFFVTEQTDGKLIVGGDFQSVAGIPRLNLARLNGDGSLDLNFRPGSGVNGSIYCSCLQSDGKVVIGGSFDTVNDVHKKGIARINTDGSLDDTFNPGADINGGPIHGIKRDTNNRLIIFGGFQTVAGVKRSCIARLTCDGKLDPTFDPGDGPQFPLVILRVYDAQIQDDGKIVVVGDFKMWNGHYQSGIVRLNSDGSQDNSFSCTVSNSSSNHLFLATVEIQSNGKILLGGTFESVNGWPITNMARIFRDGTLDPTFSIQAQPIGVSAITLQNNGKILISGWFTEVNQTPRYYLARLHGDPAVAFLQGIKARKVDGLFQLEIFGTAGKHYQYQTSQDLATWNDWFITTGNDRLIQTYDPLFGSFPSRFYRIIEE